MFAFGEKIKNLICSPGHAEYVECSFDNPAEFFCKKAEVFSLRVRKKL